MTTLIQAIAAKYNVSESAITEVREWPNVFLAIIKGIGARFVSKKLAPKSVEMPKLTGTANMIAWAEKIRANTIAKIQDRPELLAHCATKATAQWWITNRSYGNKTTQYNMIFASDLEWMLHAIKHGKLAA